MRKILILALLFQVSAVSAQEIRPLTPEQYKSSVERVDFKAHTMSIEEFKKLVDDKNVRIFDLRTEDQYEQGHIKNARHLGADMDEKRLKELIPDKNTKVIVYCNNTIFPSRQVSLNYACLPQLLQLGYKNSYILEEVWHGNMQNSTSFMKGPLWLEKK